MHNIAITGSFAVGKSFVLQCLSSMGYKVFSCDDYVRKLYEDTDMQKLVEKTVDGLGKFDKIRLSKLIYNDEKLRHKLEEIIHPKVRLAVKEFEMKNKDKDFLFTETPLLFETGFHKHFSYSICVYCSEETRIFRAQSRRGVSVEIFEKIKQIQLPQEEKKKKANFLIDGELPEDKIKIRLEEIINTLR
jgi:dephospho-CoA kinase